MLKKVYNVSLEDSFLDTFCQLLLKEIGQDHEILANYLIFLPNKRLIKNLQGAFLRVNKAKAMMLPTMVSIADIDYVMLNPVQKSLDSINLFKKVISTRERAFIIALLIQKIDVKLSFFQCIAMAESLGEIIDQSYFQEINFKNLSNVVESNLAVHWQDVLKFLYIVTEFWPNYLKEQNAIDYSYKQISIYNLQAQQWEITKPSNPIIALNLHSFYPSILNLLKTILSLAEGRLFFYGIDLSLNKDSYKELHYMHPQKSLLHTLNFLNINTKDITNITNNKNNYKEQLIYKMF